MKRYMHSPVSALCLLMTLVAVALFVPSFAQAARLLWDEQSAAVQSEAATAVTVEDFGAVGDGVHDDSEAIEDALNSGAARVEFGADKTYLYKKAIVMTASNVEIAGNGATLEWDSETSFEDWRELRIVGWEPETPVTNIYLHHLNFLTPNMSDERLVSSVQLILFNCSDVLVEECGFLITEGRGNEVNADGGRGATNIWIYGDCHNVTVQNCSLRNLSHASGTPAAGESYLGAGGNIWVSGYSGADTPDSSITDISILNNRIEKSCHDESIAVWSAESERILIDGNEFDIHEKEDGVTEYSDMIFTFGNLEGVHFTNNTVRAESRNYLFLCGGGEGSEPVDISNNDLIWTKVGSMNSTVGLVHTGANLCDVVFKDNRVLLEDSGDSGGFYRLFSSRRTKGQLIGSSPISATSMTGRRLKMTPPPLRTTILSSTQRIWETICIKAMTFTTTLLSLTTSLPTPYSLSMRWPFPGKRQISAATESYFTASAGTLPMAAPARR